MCQIRMKSLPKLYICIGLYFRFSLSEGRKNIHMETVKKNSGLTVCPLTATQLRRQIVIRQYSPSD